MVLEQCKFTLAANQWKKLYIIEYIQTIERGHMLNLSICSLQKEVTTIYIHARIQKERLFIPQWVTRNWVWGFQVCSSWRTKTTAFMFFKRSKARAADPPPGSRSVKHSLTSMVKVLECTRFEKRAAGFGLKHVINCQTVTAHTSCLNTKERQKE